MQLLAGPDSLATGGHRIPFVVGLPPGLPPSFSLKHGSAKASVTYKLKVMVDQVMRGLASQPLLQPDPPLSLHTTKTEQPILNANKNMQAGVFAKDYKASAELHLLPRAPRVPAPLAAHVQEQVTGCCCFSKGAVTMALEGPADAAAAGQALPFTVKVRLGGRNDSRRWRYRMP